MDSLVEACRLDSESAVSGSGYMQAASSTPNKIFPSQTISPNTKTKQNNQQLNNFFIDQLKNVQAFVGLIPFWYPRDNANYAEL
jgi:hypothetical protein